MFVIAWFSIATAATVPMEYGEDFFARIPATFYDVDNVAHTVTSELDFDLFDHRDTLGNEARPIRSVVIGGRVLELGEDSEIPYNIGPLSLNHGSRLMDDSVAPIGGYLLSPNSETTGTFVVDPQSPTDYAFGGEIFYSERDPTSLWWTSRIAIRLLSADQSAEDELEENTGFSLCEIRDFEAFSMEGGTYPFSTITIPHYVMLDLFTRMSAQNITASSISLTYQLEDFSEENFESLPRIQFIMQTDNQALMSLAVLEPRDYISRTEDGNYYLRLHSVEPVPDSRFNECTLDRTILKKLVVHFDVHNNRIGFGEPMVEF